MKIEINTQDSENMEARIIDAIARQFTQFAEAKVRVAIAKAILNEVERRADTVSDELIRSTVVELLAEGWEQTNTYGESTGKVMTLKERISERLIPTNRGMGLPDVPIKKFVQEEVNRVLRAEFESELTEVRKAFRAQVDAALAGKMTEALRKSVGL